MAVGPGKGKNNKGLQAPFYSYFNNKNKNKNGGGGEGKNKSQRQGHRIKKKLIFNPN